MTKKSKKNKCRLCKSKNLEEVYTFKKTPIGDDYRKTITEHNFFELINFKTSFIIFLNEERLTFYVSLSNYLHYLSNKSKYITFYYFF